MKFLLLLPLLACAHGSPYLQNEHTSTAEFKNLRRCFVPEFYGIDDTVPERQAEIVKEAFEYWNSALGFRMFYDVNLSRIPRGELATVVVVRMASEEEDTADFCARTSYQYLITGCMRKTEVLISHACLAVSDEVFETTMRHEAAHTLGLGHSDTFTDLMYSHIESTVQHPVDASPSDINNILNLYKWILNNEKN
jgi:hypothetical protein